MLISLATAVPLFNLDFFSIKNIQNIEPSQNNIHIFKYLQSIQSIGLFIISSFIAAWLFGSNKINNYLKIDKSPSFYLVILSILLIIVSIPTINYLVEINAGIKFPEKFKNIENWLKEKEENAATLTSLFIYASDFNQYIINVLVIALIPAFGEEIFFRGIIQKLSIEFFKNINVGVIIAAVLFSVLHFQFYGIIPRFILGLILGYIFIWSANIWLSVIAHFTNNFIAVTVAYIYRDNSNMTNYFENIGKSNSSSMIVFLISAVLVIAIMVIFYLYSLKFNRDINR
jgi:membrane protease YdiL (CAAX protease family)